MSRKYEREIPVLCGKGCYEFLCMACYNKHQDDQVFISFYQSGVVVDSSTRIKWLGFEFLVLATHGYTKQSKARVRTDQLRKKKKAAGNGTLGTGSIAARQNLIS
jgi:hypothetical protein